MYEIVLYEDARGYCPIQEELLQELDEMAEKDKSARIALKQVDYHIAVLGKSGTRSKNSITKHIRDGIWELKPGDNRILFFTWTNGRIVLLHSFRKTTQKTPEKEIIRALKEREDWVKRHGH